MKKNVPFHKTYIPKSFEGYFKDIVQSGKLESAGFYMNECECYAKDLLGHSQVLMFSSCTSALEAACVIAGISAGDEVILPSYTFVSSANAIVRAGGIPVFVDIDENTLCLNLEQVENSITEKTKAVMPVHYSGFSCDMDALTALAKCHNLKIIEDSAQGFLGKYKNDYLGCIGDFGCISFHNTKVFSAGEGGLLIVKNRDDYDKACLWRDKGTNRQEFVDGKVDKYGWVSKGTNAGVPELSAALLLSHFLEVDEILDKRAMLFQRYKDFFESQNTQVLTPLKQPEWNAQPNYHFYYVLLEDQKTTADFMSFLKERNVQTTQHYPPLHTSSYVRGNKLQTHHSMMTVTEHVSQCIVRLPLYTEMTESDQNFVFDVIQEYLNL